MHEIEIKIRIKDPRALVDRLVAQGCALSVPIHQHDTIYSRAGDASPWERLKEGESSCGSGATIRGRFSR